MYLEKWLEGLSCLTIFRNLLDNPVIASLYRCLRSWETRDWSRSAAATVLWCEFVSLLYQDGANLGDLICRLVLEDDNFYVHKKAWGREVPTEVEDCLKKELVFLQDMVQSDARLP